VRLRAVVRLRSLLLRALLLAVQEALLHLRPHQGPLGCQARLLLRSLVRLRSQLRLRALVRLRNGCPELRLQLN
jgi:hypothetical protein